MFDPVVLVSAQARYDDLLREAEAERKARPWRLSLLLAAIVAALGAGR